MADGDVTGLTDDEKEALTDEERDSLNDGAFDSGTDEEPEAEIDVQAQFLDWVVECFSIVDVVGSNKHFYWCAQWFEHKEVVARLVALWKAHLAAEQGDDLGAVSSWWINDWDRHATVLFDAANGPFRFCDRTRGHLSETKETGPAAPLAVPQASGGFAHSSLACQVVFGSIEHHPVRLELSGDPATNTCVVQLFDLTVKMVLVNRAAAPTFREAIETYSWAEAVEALTLTDESEP